MNFNFKYLIDVYIYLKSVYNICGPTKLRTKLVGEDHDVQ